MISLPVRHLFQVHHLFQILRLALGKKDKMLVFVELVKRGVAKPQMMSSSYPHIIHIHKVLIRRHDSWKAKIQKQMRAKTGLVNLMAGKLL